MSAMFRAAPRLLVALLLVTLTIPLETLQPDPAAVAAAAVVATNDEEQAPPATPGVDRSTSSATSTPITSLTVSKPTGTTTNDVLVAAVTVRGAPTITAPSGWTLIRSDASGTALSQALYRKVAGGSEPSSYAWTFSEP